MTAEALKERLIKELEKLPEDRLREVLDFVGYLLVKGRKEPTPKPLDSLDLQKDPILKFIGGVSHGSLAKEIDKELYGP
jgi:chaperonin cofactor prefoldin